MLLATKMRVSEKQTKKCEDVIEYTCIPKSHSFMNPKHSLAETEMRIKSRLCSHCARNTHRSRPTGTDQRAGNRKQPEGWKGCRSGRGRPVPGVMSKHRTGQSD